jgi:hypothetical protein
MDGLMRVLRNGFAHGNFRFNPGADGEIESVHVWNVIPSNRRCAGEKTWGTTFTIPQLRRLLESFVRLADHLYETAEQERRKKDDAND